MRWPFQSPSQNRAWIPSQSRAPQIEFQGNLAMIHNFRCASWDTPEGHRPDWRFHLLDLSQIQTVDLVVEFITRWRGIAHVFLSFGCETGEHFAISIESRRTQTQSFHPAAGALRQYELIYIIGEERDVVGMRAKVRNHCVQVIPTALTPPQAKKLAHIYFKNAQILGETPTYYHSIWNNCATRLIDHIGDAINIDYAPDVKSLFPGYLDEWAWQRGLIPSPAPDIKSLRESTLINDRADWHPDAAAWSRQIRSKEN